MIQNKDLEARVDRAVDYFMQGYGCCQSVVAAFADMYGLDEKLALKIAAGFGGGVGRMRMMCGAVSGIVMLVGLDEGQENLTNVDSNHVFNVGDVLWVVGERNKLRNLSI